MLSSFLPLSNPAGIDPCMDCAVENGYLFVISNDLQYMPNGIRNGCLRILSLQDKLHPQEVSLTDHLGNVRQLIVRNGIAYISAREDGLWIIDVRDVTKPKILLRYDPIEFATGLALEGSYLYVACRIFGVEVIDISDPFPFWISPLLPSARAGDLRFSTFPIEPLPVRFPA